MVVMFLNVMLTKPSWFHYDPPPPPMGCAQWIISMWHQTQKSLARSSTLKTFNSKSHSCPSKQTVNVEAFWLFNCKLTAGVACSSEPLQRHGVSSHRTIQYYTLGLCFFHGLHLK